MLARDTQFGSGEFKRQATASALPDGTDEYSPFWSPPGTRRASSRGANRSESTGVSADGKRAARGRSLHTPSMDMNFCAPGSQMGLRTFLTEAHSAGEYRGNFSLALVAAERHTPLPLPRPRRWPRWVFDETRATHGR